MWLTKHIQHNCPCSVTIFTTEHKSIVTAVHRSEVELYILTQRRSCYQSAGFRAEIKFSSAYATAAAKNKILSGRNIVWTTDTYKCCM